MRHFPTLIVTMVAAFLAGCSLITAPTHDEVLNQALPESTKIPAAWASGANANTVSNYWLKSLNDPALEAIVDEALANNLDLRYAAEQVRIAQQSVIVAGAQLLPQVGATLGSRVIKDEGNDSSNSTAVFAGVSWELDVWGKLRAQRAASQAGYEATALEYDFARQSLAATVARTWYLAIETRQLLDLAEQAVSIFSEQLRLVKIRRHAGKDTDLNIADSRAKLESAQSAVESARESYSDIRRALELLLGRYPAAEIGVAAAYPPLTAAPGAGVPASLLERRPDIMAAERVVLAAFRTKEAAQLALRPDFSFMLGGGRLSDVLFTLLRLNPWFATAAIGMSIPIYEGGALDAKVEIATAQQAQAVARYGNIVLKAFREVETALANQQLLDRRLPLEESAVNDRTIAVNIATVQYLAGNKDLLWVSNLQSNKLDTQAELLKVRGLRHLNRINMLLALGGSFDIAPAVRQSAEQAN